MNVSKFLSAGALIATGAFSQYTLAAPITCASPGVTLTTWSAAVDGCLSQDMVFKYINTDLVIGNANLTAAFFVDAPLTGQDLHTASFGVSRPPNETRFLDYSVEIDQIIEPGGTFRSGQVNSTATTGTGGVSVSSGFYSNSSFAVGALLATVTSTNSAPSLISTAILGLQKIWVRDTFITGAGATITNATNYFVMETVPEPATLTLFGLGLAGLAARNRRGRQA